MATKGCWTCKERKVSCDRAHPHCSRCVKSKRTCGGYGVRLVWSKTRSSRPPSSIETDYRDVSRSQEVVHWVNVVPTDVRLHLVTSASKGHVNFMRRDLLSIPHMPEPNISKYDEEMSNGLELIQYFETVIVNILPMLYTDRSRLGRMIIEVALSNRSQSSNGVYYAVLALASHHRGDSLMQVDRYKRAALRCLYLHQDPDLCEATEHVAANLILCVLEMQQTSGANSAWVGYISGVKQVIDAFKSHQTSTHHRASIVLGWVYYFDVMTRFSFRHWRTEQIRAIANELGFSPNGSQTCALQYLLARASFAQGVPNIAAHAHPVVALLAEVTYTSMYSSEPGYASTEYQCHLENLRLRLEDVSPKLSDSQDMAPDEVSQSETLLELARLAGMIYLERVSRNLSGPSAKIESWTRQALDMISSLDTCHCPMALFFIGCEVATDEDRMIILDMYARMEARPHLQHSLEVRSLIQTAWNQQDLAENGARDYIHMLNLIMSSRDVVPRLM